MVKSKTVFRAYSSKGVDKNGAKCNMVFGRTTKINPRPSSAANHSICPVARRTPAPQIEMACTLDKDLFVKICDVLGEARQPEWA